MNTRQKQIIRCSERYIKGLKHILGKSEVELRVAYKHKRDYRKKARGWAMDELSNELLQVYGKEIFYESAELLNNNLIK